MGSTEQAWPADGIDAVGVVLADGDVAVAAGTDDQIRVVGLAGRDRLAAVGLERAEQVGNWLIVHVMGRHTGEPVTVYLPRTKQWQIDVSTAHGDVEVSEVDGRLRLMTGQGDVHVAHCRGLFHVSAGAGDIGLEHCRQTAVPAALTAPEDTNDAGGAAGHERAGWLAAPARSIAAAMETLERRLARLPGRNAPGDDAGVVIHGGSGDIQLNDIDLTACSIRLGRGDVSLAGARVGALRVAVGQGDIECTEATPLGPWDIETVQGDISLELPAETPARFDVATSHGSIHSAAPLVRVARPGPETRHGGRMVGSYGRADAQTPQVRMATGRGDIEIGLVDDGAVGAAAPVSRGVDEPAEPTAAAAAQGPEMDILQALSDGLIDAAEAERLLRSIGA